MQNERIRTLFKQINFLALMLGGIFLTFGCNPITKVDESQNRRRDSQVFAGSGKAKVFLANPKVLKNKYVKSIDYDGKLVTRFITDNDFLSTRCEFSQFLSFSTTIPFTDTTPNDCFNVLNDRNASTDPLPSKNGSWNFSAGTDEFYQVNTYYHVNLITQRFLESLSFTHGQVHVDGNLQVPPATKYNLNDTNTYWLTDNGATANLDIFSKCYLKPMNAFFSGADNQICLGWNEDDSDFFIAQDPTVTYHEMGHAFVKIMLNQRNVTSGVDPSNSITAYYEALDFNSSLGDLFYDEPGSINEGIADWFTYYMTNRTEMGEFALFKLQGLARPVSEDSDQHTTTVSTTSAGRLSYPQFLQYNPPNLAENVEDVHNAGTIVAHYLVALQEELKTSCSFDTNDEDEIHEKTGDYVFLLLNETLAEIGDLTAKGSDYFSEYAHGDDDYEDVFFTNLNPDNSFLWTQKVNPANFRRFFRIFGKNIYAHITGGICPGFSLDESEQLMDDYGLLLFDSYENKGNGNFLGGTIALIYANFEAEHDLFNNLFFNANSINQFVNEDNRRKTILISKELIEISEDQGTAFVFDGQKELATLISFLTFEGENVETTEGLAGTEYNNDNAKISPGEVVGLSLNLFNNSNSTMAGVQFLANDWDHMKLESTSENYVNRIENINGFANNDISGGIAKHYPCIFNDFPKESEGGIDPAKETTDQAGNCNYITRDNAGIDTSEVVNDTHPKYDFDSPQPICLVEFSGDNETQWVSQDYFRKHDLDLEDDQCLNNRSMSGNEFNPNECLIRVLPGAEHAILGKIDPQSTWADTIKGEGDSVVFNQSGIVLMEVNKWIEPGTRFNCRFRVRFSNCSDCYNSGEIDEEDDYQDYEYAGAKPYKVINLQFEVID